MTVTTPSPTPPPSSRSSLPSPHAKAHHEKILHTIKTKTESNILLIDVETTINYNNDLLEEAFATILANADGSNPIERICIQLATTGIEAIQIFESIRLQKQPIDLVIFMSVDETSKLNGSQTARLLRLLNCPSPIIGLTCNPTNTLGDGEEKPTLFGDLSLNIFKAILLGPLTKELALTILTKYLNLEGRRHRNSGFGVDTFDECGGEGFKKILKEVAQLNQVAQDKFNDANDSISSVAVVEEVIRQKILIVDDSTVTRKLQASRFTKAFAKFNLDIQVDMATDGDEAVRKVEIGNNYMMIIMDMEMKRVSGMDAIKVLRMLKVSSLIVACTSHTAEGLMGGDTVLGDMLLGMLDHFVQKPLDMDKSFEIVTRFILPQFIDIPIHLSVSTVGKWYNYGEDEKELNSGVLRGLMAYMQNKRAQEHFLQNLQFQAMKKQQQGEEMVVMVENSRKNPLEEMASKEEIGKEEIKAGDVEV